MLMQKQREEIVRVGKLLYDRGLVQLCGGNISICDRETGMVAIKPSGKAYIDMQPEDVIVIDLNGKVIEGKTSPSIETPMHTEIYKARPDIKAIVHCHPPLAVAWSNKGKKYLRSVIAAMYMTKGAIMVAPYEDAGTKALADSAVKAIGKDGYGCILQAHGVICGSAYSVFQAMEMCFVIEDAVKIAIVSELMGGETFYIDEQLGQAGGYDGMERIQKADREG
ncbi:MAG: class II aldolase/adducin family protein [Clostridiaceae bacterium]